MLIQYIFSNSNFVNRDLPTTKIARSTPMIDDVKETNVGMIWKAS